MSTSHTTRAHAQEVWDKSDKDYVRAAVDFEVNKKKIMVASQSGRKVVPHNSKSDLPLAPM